MTGHHLNFCSSSSLTYIWVTGPQCVNEPTASEVPWTRWEACSVLLWSDPNQRVKLLKTNPNFASLNPIPLWTQIQCLQQFMQHSMFVGLRPVIQILCHVLAQGWGRWLKYFTKAKAEVKYLASAQYIYIYITFWNTLWHPLTFDHVKIKHFVTSSDIWSCYNQKWYITSWISSIVNFTLCIKLMVYPYNPV